MQKSSKKITVVEMAYSNNIDYKEVNKMKCSTDHVTWGWVINDRIFIFEWTIH